MLVVLVLVAALVPYAVIMAPPRRMAMVAFPLVILSLLWATMSLAHADRATALAGAGHLHGLAGLLVALALAQAWLAGVARVVSAGLVHVGLARIGLAVRLLPALLLPAFVILQFARAV